jgi:F-type H+-transporting ATPase subunit epsilon
MAEFTFRLVTPQRLLFEGPALSVQAPGSEGYLGILANHAPLITALKPGKLEVKDPKGIVTTYAVSGGFLEVSDNRASVLADSAEPATAIDRERAAAAMKRAEERLRGAARRRVPTRSTAIAPARHGAGENRLAVAHRAATRGGKRTRSAPNVSRHARTLPPRRRSNVRERVSSPPSVGEAKHRRPATLTHDDPRHRNLLRRHGRRRRPGRRRLLAHVVRAQDVHSRVRRRRPELASRAHITLYP